MNIPKAIELLQLDLDDPGSVPIEDLNEAQTLSIEALKRVNHIRPNEAYANMTRLPGETPPDQQET